MSAVQEALDRGPRVRSGCAAQLVPGPPRRLRAVHPPPVPRAIRRRSLIATGRRTFAEDPVQVPFQSQHRRSAARRRRTDRPAWRPRPSAGSTDQRRRRSLEGRTVPEPPAALGVERSRATRGAPSAGEHGSSGASGPARTPPLRRVDRGADVWCSSASCGAAGVASRRGARPGASGGQRRRGGTPPARSRGDRAGPAEYQRDTRRPAARRGAGARSRCPRHASRLGRHAPGPGQPPCPATATQR
jgi:hypothetical protein